MQRVVFAADFFGEQHHVFVLRAENDSMTLEGLEVGGGGQGRGHSVPRDGYISEVKLAADGSDARVLDAEFLIFVCRPKSRAVNGTKLPAIAVTMPATKNGPTKTAPAFRLIGDSLPASGLRR